MNYYKFISELDKQEYVDFIKDELNIQLENELFAEFDDIIDQIYSSTITPTNKLVLKFANACEDMFLEARFEPYDYNVKYTHKTCTSAFIKQMETEQEHENNRKKYISFVANKLEQICGKQAKNDYLKLASKKIAVDENVM